MRHVLSGPGRLWIAVCLLLATQVAGALSVDRAVPRYDLAAHVEVVEDRQADLLFDDLRRGSANWQPLRQDVANFGYSLSAYWFRLRLENPGEQAMARLVEVGYPLLDHVDLWMVDGDGRLLLEVRAGDRLPFTERPLQHRNFVFPLQLAAGGDYQLYLRVQSSSSTQVPLTLWAPDAFHANNEWTLMGQGLYVGIMLAMIAYNLFIYFSIRSRAYLYYVLFSACTGLFFIELRGLPYEFLWPRAVWWQGHGIAFLAAATPLFGSLFAMSFLNLRQHSLVLHRGLQAVVAAAGMNLLLVPWLSYPQSIRIGVSIILVWVLMMVVAGVVALLRGEKAARYYLLAWGLFLFAAFFTTIYQFGVIPKGLVGEYTLQIGSALEALLLSFALADRINQMRKEKDQAQREAVDHLQRYQTLYQEARYGIFTTREDGRLVSCNPEAARMLGYRSPSEAKSLVANVPEQLYVDAGERDRMLAVLHEQGHVNGFETQMRRKDGSTLWVALSARLAGGDDGRYLEGTLHDVSERVERQRAERARAQAEREREAAEAAAAAKGVFLSNMSHEIRTPLTAVIGYAEFLAEPSVDETRRTELAGSIVRSGRHLLTLINDILDLSKIEAGGLTVEQMPVDPFVLLVDLQAAFEPRARHKGLRFSVSHQFPLPACIRSDPTRLKQILYNLCDNAVKFTEAGEVRVTVSCDPAARLLRLEVADSGIGIAEDQQAAVFDAFAQADASTTRRYGGSGLGLSISRQLARMLGGDIRLDSRPGEGSRFVVTVATGELDAVRWVDHLDLVPAPPTVDAPPPEIPRLGGRVLHAEDNREAQKLVAVLVRQTGAEIVTVGNGQEAVEALSRESFDLVLLDIQMPVMDGYGALAEMRRQGFHGPVAALTANVMAEDRAGYRAAGFDACAAKPIERQVFFRLLSDYLPAAAAPAAVSLRGRVLLVEAEPDERLRLEIERSGAELARLGDGQLAVETLLAQEFDLVLMEADLPILDGFAATRLLRQAGRAVPIYLLGLDDAAVAVEAGFTGALAPAPEQLRVVLQRHLGPAAAAEPVVESFDLSALTAQFRDSLPGLLRELEAADQAGDRAAVGRLAHQLKGLAGNFGYDRITAVAGQLDRALKAGQQAEADWLYQALKRELENAIEAA